MEKKKVIVVIDNNKEILEMLHLILRNSYEVQCFTEPPEDFLSILATKKTDLLIMDWLIPNVNIEDLIHPIKTCDEDIKIIIISAHQSVHQAFREKPVEAILQKPFGSLKLKNTITKILSSEDQIKNINKS